MYRFRPCSFSSFIWSNFTFPVAPWCRVVCTESRIIPSQTRRFSSCFLHQQMAFVIEKQTIDFTITASLNLPRTSPPFQSQIPSKRHHQILERHYRRHRPPQKPRRIARMTVSSMFSHRHLARDKQWEKLGKITRDTLSSKSRKIANFHQPRSLDSLLSCSLLTALLDFINDYDQNKKQITLSCAFPNHPRADFNFFRH